MKKQSADTEKAAKPTRAARFRRALFSMHGNGAKTDMSVTLNDCYTMPALADNGATGTPCILRRHLREIQLIDEKVVTRTLNEPVTYVTAGGHELVSSEVVSLKITILTASGPVTTYRPFECSVVEEDEEEFLISRPVLLSLGIDVDAQLNDIARQLQSATNEADEDDGSLNTKDYSMEQVQNDAESVSS